MWPLSAAAQATLRRSHAVSYRATAYRPDGQQLPLPITTGSVSYDAASMVRRTGELTVSDPRLWDAVHPFGTEVAVEYGITTQDAVEWVPLLRGVVTKTADSRPRSTDAGFTLGLADRSVLVAQDRFEQPAQLVGGSYVDNIAALITESLPDVTVTDQTGDTQPMPAFDVDKERWGDGVEKLADAIAAEAFADRVGGFVLRPVPTLTAGPVWTVDAGNAGVLITVGRELTREAVFNAVIASGQRTDGTPAVWAKVIDSDNTSPTVYGGPFGRRPRFYSSAAINTQAQAQSAAAALLERVRGIHATLAFTLVTNPALDPGDVIVSRFDGAEQRHIIDSVTVPLDPGTAQQIKTRSLDIPAES